VRKAAQHLCWFLGCAAGLLTPVPGPASGQVLPEYTLKAAYLTKFVPFIDWPDAVFASPTAPVTICVVGEDPFGATLDKAAAVVAAGGRKLAVRRIPEANADTGTACQIVYVSDSQVGYDAVDALKDKPVITVTESTMRARGIINFLTLDNHVRFDIDEAAAEKNGVHISSKLLGLAHNVTQKSAAP
jgi:hypothetical protein